MKQHAKVGNRAGKPAYRTPSSFRGSQHLRTDAYKAKFQGAKPFPGDEHGDRPYPDRGPAHGKPKT